MTLQEAEQALPNKFSEAKIDSLTFHASERSLRLTVELWMGTVFDKFEQVEEYRRGELIFTGVDQFAAEKLHGKYLPMTWTMRSIETETSDVAGQLSVYRLNLGFKEYLAITAESVTFEWAG